jgi:hypothetical protein
MNFMTFTKTMMVATTLSLFQMAGAYALTDMEAIEDGMTLESEFTMNEMKSILSPTQTITSHKIMDAVNTHRLVIAINKASKGPNAQTLTMYENGVEILKEKVSTGKEERVTSASGRTYVSTTPKGYFRPTKLYRDYLSYTWNAPMPNSVFFIGGIAVHATGESNYRLLGKRASGGCVRVKLPTSKLIREKVMETGKGNQPGEYKIVNEAKGRNRVANNSVSVSNLNRTSGSLLKTNVNSWDTVIIVYEE